MQSHSLYLLGRIEYTKITTEYGCDYSVVTRFELKSINVFHISNLNTPGQPVLYEGMEPKQKISNRNKMLSSLENLQSSTYSTRRKYYTI